MIQSRIDLRVFPFTVLNLNLIKWVDDISQPSSEEKQKRWWAGSDLNARPPPCQGDVIAL